MGKFNGKVAVVTGGSRDIGRAISVQLAQEGAKVVVNYFNSEAGAKETVDEIKSAGGEAIAVKADVSNLNDIKHLKAKAVEAVFVMQAFEPLMGKGGSIINLSSLAARDGGGGGSSLYASSKGAVTTFTRAMAKELGPKGIRVNALCPGMIATKFHDDFTPDSVREMVAGKTPVRREGSAEEVADLVLYLASDKSSFVTGSNFDINGGLAFS